MKDIIQKALIASEIFEGLAPAEADALAGLFRAQELGPGAVLFEDGAPADSFFVVLGGSVQLEPREGPVVERRAGTSFGELGLAGGQVRRARATAGAEGARLARLARLAFERLVEEDLPRFGAIAATVRAQLRARGAQPAVPVERDVAAGSPRLIAYAAPRDGVGRTTLAVNHAALAATQGARVALVDLDPQGGDVALLARVAPERSWVGLFPEGGGDPDLSQPTLRAWLIPAGGGVFVLPAPPRAEAARTPSIGDVGRLLAALGAAFDLVVVDAPAGTGALAEAIFRAADSVLVVGAYNAQGVFALNKQLAALGRMGLPAGRVQVVLNRIGRPDDVREKEPEMLLLPALARVPEDGEIGLAPSRGRPDVLARPSGSLALSLRRLRRRLESVPRRLARPAARGQEAKARARLQLGRALFLEGRLTEARPELEAAAVDLGRDPEPAVILGRLFEARGELRRAHECFKAGLEADPGDLHAMARAAALGRNPVVLGAARRRLDDAMARFPARADYRLLSGLVAGATGDRVRAGDEFRHALRLNPTYAEAHRRLGEACLAAGETDRGILALRRAAEATPREPAALWGLVGAYESLGLLGAAAESLEALLAMVPDHGPGTAARTRLAERLAAVDQELASFDRALALTGRFPDVLLLRAGAWLRRGCVEEAARDAAEALERGADLPGARRILGRMRLLGGSERSPPGAPLAAAA